MRSGCGRFLAAVCRDGKLWIFCPLREDGVIVAMKSARVVWACKGRYLVTTGFSRQSRLVRAPDHGLAE